MRVERDDVRLTPEVVERLLDVVRGQRADSAEVLGQDQLGIQPGERLRVQGVEVGPGGHLRADVSVDLPRRHPRRVATSDDDGLVHPRRRRLIALESHADQLVAEPERVDDLGRGGQQRDDSHVPQAIRTRDLARPSGR
jgi:hypothetical protein